MALFSKNANETAFVGGKKHWIDVIKNTGSGDLLIWRQPEEDFNTNSTLIVMPGEEAIFIKGGTVEQTFDNGTYKLSTENYPFISRLRTIFSGGISTFNCVVYFVRKAQSIEVLWGTTSPLQVRDKLVGVNTKICGRGAYKVRVDNGVKLLNKLLGNNVNVLLQQELDLYFSNEFQSKIRSSLTKALVDLQTELLGVEARLDEFSESIKPLLSPILEDYGLSLMSFSVAALDIEDVDGGSLRKKYDEAIIEAKGRIIEAHTTQAEFDILGSNWNTVRSADILETLAGNPGAGGTAATGAGLGMGIAAGSVFSGLANTMFGSQQSSPPPLTPQPSGRFSQQSSSSPNPTATSEVSDPVASLRRLREMLDNGLITQALYDSKQAEILARM
ncbi:hypothetical protein FACS1894188_08130 [Clostridia bacterium]|nr:hypothetical protein FACS1894188_08130 [Clostridia bacterium]